VSQKPSAEKYKFIDSALRRAGYAWEPRQAAKKAARIRRGWYSCNHCKGETKAAEIKLDHVVPINDPTESNWNGWDGIVDRHLPEIEGWQVLCKACHTEKTNIENSCRHEIRAAIKKYHKELDAWTLPTIGLEAKK
jgi:5-methylcytosine-specific restriction endonuclease McrA